MENVKKVFCVTNDEALVSHIDSFSYDHVRGDFEIQAIDYESGELVVSVVEHMPNIVIIDFVNENHLNGILKEIVFLKRIYKFQSVLFAAIFPGAISDEFIQLVYSSGVQIGFIKGGELDTFLADCFYLGVDDLSSIPRYARARKIDRTLEVGMVSSLRSLSADYFCIETDCEIFDKKLSTRLPMFKDLKCRQFEVISHDSASKLYPYLESYELALPFPGPWDEMTEELILQETVNTWLDLNQETLQLTKGSVKIITENATILPEVFECSKEAPYNLSIAMGASLEEIKKQISANQPELIFYDLSSNSDNEIENLESLIRYVKSFPELRPVFLITHTKSKSEAFQKVYGYSQIVCLDHKLDSKIFNLFVNTYLEKSISSSQCEEYKLNLTDPRRAMDVFINVEVTSLTEHEFSFISDLDLPMYTVLHLNLPVKCYATIVPSYYELEASRKGKHYLAIFHGMVEDEAQKLRIVVNQIIYEPLKAFTSEIIEKLLEKENIEAPEIIRPVDKKSDSQENTDIIVEDNSYTKSKIQGKSKL